MPANKRSWLRFQTVMPVLIRSKTHGDFRCVARNVSEGGICVEMREALPLGSNIEVEFIAPDGTKIGASGVVRNQYVFNYCRDRRHRQLRGIGVRFSDFDDGSAKDLNVALDRIGPLH